MQVSEHSSEYYIALTAFSKKIQVAFVCFFSLPLASFLELARLFPCDGTNYI